MQYVGIYSFRLLLLVCRIGQPGAAARLECSVKDSSGAFVPAASFNQWAHGTRTEASAAAAGLSYSPLPPGVYTLRIEAEDFAQARFLNSSGTRVIHSSKYCVESAMFLTRSCRSARSACKRQTPRSRALPHSGTYRRCHSADATHDLALFSAGVQINQGPNAVARKRHLRRIQMTRDWTDDVSDNSVPGSSDQPVPQPDPIEETRIVTSGKESSAAMRRQIQPITRSGTNSWHGNARISSHSTQRQHFRQRFGPQASDVQNTFGASLGGLPGAALHFGNYQGRRNAQG
jgi:hypothetical protein